MTTETSNTNWSGFFVANLAVFSVIVYAWILHEFYPDLYRSSVQEDEFLERGTFWAFILAAGVFVWTGIKQRIEIGGWPWFLIGVGLFCILVAMEEISWGQRIFAYRPPTYFLEQNFQQELNIHNVMSTPFRMLTLKAIILGYGVVLPLATLWPWLKTILDRIGIASPPIALVPAFAITYITYEIYPWKGSGELVELMLGLGFLFAAIDSCRSYVSGVVLRTPWMVQAFASLVVIGLGLTNAATSRHLRGGSEWLIATTHSEAVALGRDYLEITRDNDGYLITECGTAKRVNSFVQEAQQDSFGQRWFYPLIKQGLPQDRADFFLDPWNMPYWIVHKCDSAGRQSVFLFSFGPDRRRDSSAWEIQGNDIGVMIDEFSPSADVEAETA